MLKQPHDHLIFDHFRYFVSYFYSNCAPVPQVWHIFYINNTLLRIYAYIYKYIHIISYRKLLCSLLFDLQMNSELVNLLKIIASLLVMISHNIKVQKIYNREQNELTKYLSAS